MSTPTRKSLRGSSSNRVTFSIPKQQSSTSQQQELQQESSNNNIIYTFDEEKDYLEDDSHHDGFPTMPKLMIKTQDSDLTFGTANSYNSRSSSIRSIDSDVMETISVTATINTAATSGTSGSGGGSSSSSRNSRGWKILKKYLSNGDLALKLNEQTSNKKKRTRSSIRRQVFNEFHSGTSFTIHQCLVAIVAYVIVSVLIFSFVLEPEWTIIDSCYFAVTTFTTLGYGDLTPTSHLSRFFTCAYALLGVLCLGLALGILGNQMIEQHQHATNRAEEVSKLHMMSLFSSLSSFASPNNNKNSSSTTGNSNTAAHELVAAACQEMTASIRHKQSLSSSPNQRPSLFDTIKSSVVSKRSSIFEKQSLNVSVTCILIILMLVLAFWIGTIESGWGIADTIYFLIITGSTIGYGDLTPTTQTGRLLAVFFIPLSCGVTGHFLGWIANRMIDNKEQQFLHDFTSKRKELTQEDIDAMDTNNDGKVSWAEFLEFMLVAMNKIDYEFLDELQEHFQNLDLSGTGELSRDDLTELARRKRQSPRRKLELASYKRYLLHQADCEKQKRQEQQQALLNMDWIPQLPQLFRGKSDQVFSLQQKQMQQQKQLQQQQNSRKTKPRLYHSSRNSYGSFGSTSSTGSDMDLWKPSSSSRKLVGWAEEDDDDDDDFHYDLESPESLVSGGMDGSASSIASCQSNNNVDRIIRHSVFF